MKRIISNHLLPIIAFVLLATAFYAYNHHHYRKDPGNTTSAYSFKRTFLAGRYDQGIYRGIGVTAYRDGARVGWYPGASIAGGILWRLAGRPAEAGIGATIFYLAYYIPSILAGLLYFYCFYRYAFITWGPKTAVLALLSLVCFPPSFYFLTAFPYNLTLAGMAAYLLVHASGVRGRLGWLAGIAFLCSLTYPSAILFALFPLTAEGLRQHRARSFDWRPFVAYGLPFALGPLVFFAYLYAVTGDFWAYLYHQGRYYERTFGSVIDSILHYFYAFPLMHPENLTALLVTLYLLLFSTRKLGAPLWVFMVAILLFSPLTGSFQCVYRHYLLAFPLHYLFALSAKPLAGKLLVAGLVGFTCAKHFFILYLTQKLT